MPLESEQPGEPASRRTRDRTVYLLLALAVLLVYGQVRNFEFVHYDDPYNIPENPFVRAGLTLEGIRWAFTTVAVDYWRPLTWLSHMLDCSLYGLNAGGHHVTNVLIHLANSLLLLGFLNRATGRFWRSAFVAAVFALHPIHVGSVAWVTERKDVLCGLFFMLSLHAYGGYVRRPSVPRYLVVVLWFCLGLMSKPMVMTLPFVLLLLDVWPFQRISRAQTAAVWSTWKWLVWEKAPLLVLSAASCIFTWLTGQSTGQLTSVEEFPPGVRAANVVVSYVRYLGKLVWPAELTVYHPHPGHWPAWIVIGCLAILLVVSVAILRKRSRAPYSLVGWFWFLGMLVPVIGITQGASEESMADRFAYLPFIGVYIAITWSIAEVSAAIRYRPALLAGVAACVLLLLGVRTWVEAGYWRNSLTLFGRALEIYPANAANLNNYGLALVRAGRVPEAIGFFEESIRNEPRNASAHTNLGVELAGQERWEEAMEHYRAALRIDPRYMRAHFNLAAAFAAQGDLEKAIFHYRAALESDPGHAPTLFNLAVVLGRIGNTNEAIRHYVAAIQNAPDFMEAYNNLALALASQGKPQEAIQCYLQALRVKPDHARIHFNLAVMLASTGKPEEAAAHYRLAIELQPAYLEAHNNLGLLLLTHGHAAEAAHHFRQALQINERYVPGHSNLGLALDALGKPLEAEREFRRAVELAGENGQTNLAIEIEALLDRRARHKATASDPNVGD